MVAKIKELEAEWIALEREGEDLELQVEETIKEHEEVREKKIKSHQEWVSQLHINIFIRKNDSYLISPI